MTAEDGALEAAAAELLARHPELTGGLEQRARARLAEVLADPRVKAAYLGTEEIAP